ncbi:glucosyltransferase domain-containing protein [Dryocola sp. BD626]|uniref:glucosyltransferase domain-containing protein n=1 Tax=Dryocola sp. BD626 TaxID=3133273 RepID=UPI003F4F87C7
MKEFSVNYKTAIFLAVCSFIYMLPLIITNTYYIDDMARSLYGYGWQRDGRTLATVIMQIISGGERLSNLSPYTNIISACILSFTGYYACVISGIEKNKKYKISSLIVLTSPFMLENLTYKYDSLPMSISIAAVSLPFILNGWRFIAIAGAGACVCLMTYQASFIIFFIMASIVVSKDLIENRQTIKRLLSIVNALILGVFLTYLVNLIYPPDFAGRNKLFFTSEDPIKEITKNISGAIDVISQVFHATYIIVYSLTLLALLLSIVVIIKENKHKLMASTSIILSILAFTSFPLINILLLNPWWTARVFVGFPFSIIAILSIINYASPTIQRYISIALVVLAFPLMASYSNALSSQNKFTEDMVSRIFDGVDTVGKSVFVIGTAPRSPESIIAIENNPLLRSILPIYISNGWSWGGHFLERQGIIERKQYLSPSERERYIKNVCKFNEIKDGLNYKVLSNGKVIAIDFNKTKC